MESIKEELKGKISNKGITLIALVITIIVLLILAGVTIATLTGDNGLLGKAQEAKEKTESAEMGDKIQTSILAAKANLQGELTKEGIEEELQKEFKDEIIEAIVAGKSFIIKIGDKLYKSNGKLVEVSEIEYAGDLSKGGAYDGLSEATAYRINCIEDLVEWTNNYVTYSSKCIKLERTLDFEDPNSYSDFMNVVTNDINGDGKKEYIITELTTGTGFKPIGEFSGTFDGQANEIINIYENTTGNAGLFAKSTATISNIGITGKILTAGKSNLHGAGSVVGYGTPILRNCYSNCVVKSADNAGGIIGQGGGKIYNCYNFGHVEGDFCSGGIIGRLHGGNAVNIYNCYNKGLVVGENSGGIFGYIYAKTTVINSYNSGVIIGNKASGIGGYNYATNPYIYNCYNVGEIKNKSGGKTAGIVYHAYNYNNLDLKTIYYLNNVDMLAVLISWGNALGNNLKEPNSKEYMQSQDFVDELNRNVDNYEPAEGEEDVTLLRWKYNANDYPTF